MPVPTNENGFTEKQQAFLDAYCDPSSDTYLDFHNSRKTAGYSKVTAKHEILTGKVLAEAVKAQENYLVIEGGKAARGIISIVDDPTQLGAANKLKACDSALDRIGVTKKSQVEVKQEKPTAIVYIPTKLDNNEEN